MTTTYCYNKGCGQQFDPSLNESNSCVFHPGEPVFHDAYKGWSCCNKKCTDFTEFLNIKGCAIGPHNSVKPEEKKPTKLDGDDAKAISYCPPISAVKQIERPDPDLPMVDLNVTVAPSLSSALSKLSVDDLNLPGSQVLSVGTPCKNNGCKMSYANGPSDFDSCTHHPGYPVFHEGMKFWSCCNRKTSDFDNFLSQEGCTQGQHVWIKDEISSSSKCRYDWHQTGSHVILTIYSKLPVPDKSSIKINPVKLAIGIIYGQCEFSLVLLLHGVIDVEKSSVTYYQSKVEIKLKKAEPMSWATIGKPISTEVKVEECKKPNIVKSNVEDDLSDL